MIQIIHKFNRTLALWFIQMDFFFARCSTIRIALALIFIRFALFYWYHKESTGSLFDFVQITTGFRIIQLQWTKPVCISNAHKVKAGIFLTNQIRWIHIAKVISVKLGRIFWIVFQSFSLTCGSSDLKWRLTTLNHPRSRLSAEKWGKLGWQTELVDPNVKKVNYLVKPN